MSNFEYGGCGAMGYSQAKSLWDKNAYTFDTARSEMRTAFIWQVREQNAYAQLKRMIEITEELAASTAAFFDKFDATQKEGGAKALESLSNQRDFIKTYESVMGQVYKAISPGAEGEIDVTYDSDVFKKILNENNRSAQMLTSALAITTHMMRCANASNTTLEQIRMHLTTPEMESEFFAALDDDPESSLENPALLALMTEERHDFDPVNFSRSLAQIIIEKQDTESVFNMIQGLMNIIQTSSKCLDENLRSLTEMAELFIERKQRHDIHKEEELIARNEAALVEQNKLERRNVIGLRVVRPS